jgi:RNA polymerase sigma factor (TIGR02999 family)
MRIGVGEVTRLITALEQGDPQAAGALLPLVYHELRALAAARLAREPPGSTLQPTALVHEAYIRLVGDEPDAAWHGRKHFYLAAAQAMRRILIDRARRRKRVRHGGGLARHPADPDDLAAPLPDPRLIELDEALARFAEESPQAAELVSLRTFAGLTLEESAGVLGISRATAARLWAFARAWLFEALNEADVQPNPS